MPISGLRMNNQSIGLNTGVSILNKQSTNPDFSSHLKTAMRATTQIADRATQYAMPYVPGRALLSAAINGAANQMNTGAALASNTAVDDAGPAMGGEGVDMNQSLGDMQQNMVAENAKMLAMQTKTQQISSHYTAASNILKVKHDTEKNSINNMR